MTVRQQWRYYVVCDVCGAEHDDIAAGNALASRIGAGAKGWKYRRATKLVGQQKGARTFDLCPDHATAGPAAVGEDAKHVVDWS